MQKEITIGSRIRRLRQMEALTQAEMAEKIGISKASLSYVERGLKPSASVAVMLSKYFEIDFDDLRPNEA